MSIPVWVLLAFAMWTLLSLFGSVGVYRWIKILRDKQPINSFPSDRVEGDDWYRRSMCAHRNCIENLPVYGAIVVVMLAASVQDPTLDCLAIVFIIARVVQTSVHIAFTESVKSLIVRFSAFLTQAVCMFWMAGLIALHACAA